MTRLISTLVLMLFAFSASADETVLGTHGNERQLNGNHTVWSHSNSQWTGMPGGGADYTTGASGCVELIGSNFLSDFETCSYYLADLVFSKDTTVTSWQIEAVGSYASTFSCALRLIDGDGTVVADSEILIESTYSDGHRFSKTVNHFFDASDISQRNLSVQVKEASTCAAGSGCSCDANGISIIRFFGVD